MHKLAERLFPICRSLTGSGVRETFRILQEMNPIKTFEVPSGTSCFDWVVPQEWVIRDAWIKNSKGEKIIDFKSNNLHLVSYSEPVHEKLNLNELQLRLHSLPELPFAVPYITAYYKKTWGFCLTETQRSQLLEDTYEVMVDSEFISGSLTYGEMIVPGASSKEIFVSTYICHPSMGNNELSGPVVASYLAKWVRENPRHYTYRFVFIPETIGSVMYVSKNLQQLKRQVVAAFNLTCCGDPGEFSFLPSRNGDTLADEVAKHVLSYAAPQAKHYSFLDRGSDERQYCSPGVDLPMVSIMRSKYGTYKEYHTSLDNLSFITDQALNETLQMHIKCFEALEANDVFRAVYPCEPQLGKRGLYPQLGTRETKEIVKDMMNFLAYADGHLSLLKIAEKTNQPIWSLVKIATKLAEAGLVEKVGEKE